MQNNQDKQPETNFFKFEPQKFAFAQSAPKPATFSFAENVGTIKFDFDPKKAEANREKTVDKIHFREIQQGEQEIIIEKEDILYYILQELQDENNQQVQQYVKGEKSKVQLVKTDGEVMLVARISGSAPAEDDGATKHVPFDRIVYEMQVCSTIFEMDKFLKATGSNLMVRQRTKDRELKPIVETFLFKGEGISEIFAEIEKCKKE